MPIVREQVLGALLARLRTIPAATAKREEPLPEKVPAEGLIILRDGDPGEPEVLLSPLLYLWSHQVDVEVIVSTAADANTVLDDLLAAVDGVMAADRSLGGLVDWCDWDGPRTHDLAIDGAAGLKGAVVAVTLHYETSSPLS